MSSKYRYFSIIFVYCNLFVFRILGLLPWKIHLSPLKIHPGSKVDKRDQDDTKKLVCHSIWGLVYSVMLIICNFMLVRYAMEGLLEVNRVFKIPIIIQGVHLGIGTFEIFSVTCVWILYICRKNTIFHINEQLMEVKRMLNRSINYNWQVTPRIIFIFSINIGVSIMSAVSLLAEYGFMYSCSWYISVVANAWVLIQYALILEVIHHQLKMINREILNLGNISDNIRIRNVFISKLPIKSCSECHIMNLKYAYVHFCEIFDRLSNFYAIPVILIVICFGLIITFTAYYIFVKFYVIENLLTCNGNISECLWFVIIASTFITLIAVVNDVKREISIIPDNIHWLLNFCSMPEEMESTLIEFSNDLLSRKVNFTAYGIISLDGSLLFSVLGSSITYIVILIQFQLR